MFAVFGSALTAVDETGRFDHQRHPSENEDTGSGPGGTPPNVGSRTCAACGAGAPPLVWNPRPAVAARKDATMANEASAIEEARSTFGRQRSSYSRSAVPSYEVRVDRLERIDAMCRGHVDEFTEALHADFGCRSPDQTFIADVYPQLAHVKHVRRNLRRWMRKQRTSSGLFSLTGQRTYIVHEPLGVVGIMSPFNVPVGLALVPAIEALAAGNSVMIKISENTPRTSELLRSLVARYFKPEEIAVIEGGPDVSRAFAALPWDLLLFTGGTEVGREILAAAAANLTPVILELGGKCPCVLLEDADIGEAARKIGRVRQLNAGQVCVAGDYVFLPTRHLEAFIEAVMRGDKEAYGSILDNPQFTSVIHDGAYDRLVGYIEEAKSAGCRIVQCNPKNEAVPDRKTRKIPLTLVVNPANDLMVCREEIFGPVLPIHTYEKLDDAIAHINGNEKPLALYIFGRNRRQIDRIVNSTSSGGVTVNDLLVHVLSNTMGFGGVGSSGMGRYRGGHVGYKAFSNPKSVFEQGLMRKFTGILLPPFKSDRVRNVARRQVGVD